MNLQRKLIQVTGILILISAVVMPFSSTGLADKSTLTGHQRKTLQVYAQDTWQSFLAMLEPGTGLPADNVTVDGERFTRKMIVQRKIASQK